MLKSFADGAIFGERFGEGSPQILALHGWGRDRRDFSEVLRGLDALAIDLPGFGASPAPSELIGAAGFAELVSPVLRENDEPVVLLGHSFGGRIALHLATSEPGRVAGLVLAGVPLLRRSDFGSRPSPLAYRIVRTLSRWGLIGEDRLEHARRRYGSADYRAARGLMRDILVKVVGETYETELANITQPVHLLWGSDDREVPVEVAQRAVSQLARGELSVLEGVGHHVCLEAPEAVRSAILGIGS